VYYSLNLVEDKEQTKRRASEQAAQAVTLCVVSVQREVILGGEAIEANFVLPDRFNLSRRGINCTVSVIFSLVSGSVGVLLAGRAMSLSCSLRQRPSGDSLLTISTPPDFIWRLLYRDLPAPGLLVGSFTVQLWG
jgi:membrane-associated HD superfamily phosphohydrolase